MEMQEKKMKSDSPDTELSDQLAELNEDAVISLVTKRLKEGADPLNIVEECQKGVRIVGERYEKGIYYISGLIMAGEILNQVGEMVFPLLKSKVSGTDSGIVLLGTVSGDIHYIGKDIVKVLLQCFGFTVTDIGVDVPAKEFLAKTLEIKPNIVGISCLLSSCYNSLVDTIKLIRKEIKPTPAVIIGGFVDEQACQYIGADAWANDAMTGIRVCQQIMQKHKNN
jgi:methanogenic corrinoid protein MtbC1